MPETKHNSPTRSYSCEVISQTDGYVFLFTEGFLKVSESEWSERFLESPFFKIGGTPVLQVDQEQKTSIAAVCQKMLIEQEADYTFKDELIRDYISLIFHEAMKMMPY